jgi:hypothetical protein
MLHLLLYNKSYMYSKELSHFAVMWYIWCSSDHLTPLNKSIRCLQSLRFKLCQFFMLGNGRLCWCFYISCILFLDVKYSKAMLCIWTHTHPHTQDSFVSWWSLPLITWRPSTIWIKKAFIVLHWERLAPMGLQ